MDHKQLAMVIWSLARLDHRPRPAWMGSFLAAAQQLLAPVTPPHPVTMSTHGDAGDVAASAAAPAAQPGKLLGAASSSGSGSGVGSGSSGGGSGGRISLLSVATLLASLQHLDFLPPSSFMAAAHSSASAAVRDDPTPSGPQRELLSDRVNTAVAWYKQRLLQLVAASGGSSIMSSSDEEQQQQQLTVQTQQQQQLTIQTQQQQLQQLIGQNQQQQERGREQQGDQLRRAGAAGGSVQQAHAAAAPTAMVVAAAAAAGAPDGLSPAVDPAGRPLEGC